MKNWWMNGGRKDVFYISVALGIVGWLIKSSFSLGSIQARFETVEKKIPQIEKVAQDIEVIKNDVAWIKETLRRTGK